MNTFTKVSMIENFTPHPHESGTGVSPGVTENIGSLERIIYLPFAFVPGYMWGKGLRLSTRSRQTIKETS